MSMNVPIKKWIALGALELKFCDIVAMVQWKAWIFQLWSLSF
jgi:hypothetical protein